MPEYQKGLFHEGFLKPERLDKSQVRLNSVRINPLAFNIEFNCWNYQVWFSDLCSLLSEAQGKLSDDEQTDLERLRDLIDDALVYFPPHKTIRNDALNTKITKIKYSNWQKIKTFLNLFEREIKMALDRHGLSNPDIEGEGLF